LTAPGSAQAGTGRRTILRGREPELGALGEALQATHRGHGRVLVVDGPPGIGKSELLEEAGRMAVRLHVRSAVGEASAGQQAVPFAPLLAALLDGENPIARREVVRELGASADLRYWLVEELSAALEATALRAPVMIALDDLHWADAATLMALRTMTARLAELPIVWVLAMRRDEGSPALRELVAELVGQGALCLSLDGLSDDAVGAVVADRLAAAGAPALLELAATARGNPFLLVELLDGLREEHRVSLAADQAQVCGTDLPGRLTASMRHRLAGLSDEARRAVRAAVVLGRRFDVEQLAALLSRTPSQLADPIEEALRADLLSESGDRLRFRHDLIRQAVLETLPQPLRRSLLREAVTVMLAGGAAPVDVAAQLAASAQVGDATAIATLREAARVLSRSDAGAAADMSLRAVGLTPRADPSRSQLVADTVVLLHAALRDVEATELAAVALEGALPAEEEGRVRLSLSAMILRPSAPRADENRRALALPGLSPGLRAQHLAFLSFALAAGGYLADGEAAVPDALAAAREAGDVTALAVATIAQASASSQRGAYGTALELLTELPRTPGWDSTQIYARMAEFHRADALAALGRLDEATALMHAGLARAQRERTTWLLSGWVGFGSHLRYAAGALGDARADAEAFESMHMGDASSTARAVGMLTWFQVAQHTDDREQMSRLVHAARALGPETNPATQLHADWILALKAVADGNAAEAVRRLRGDRPAFAIPVMPSDPTLQPQIARIALAAGDAELAHEAVAFADRLADQNPGAAMLAGAAAHVRGLVDGAVEPTLAAVELLRDAQRPLALASAEEDAGAALVREARVDEGIDLLATAHERWASAGATADARRVARRLRDHGVRRPSASPQRPATGWDSLTESELRVVRVVGAGATNREAADELFLSPHTVSSHLRHAFVKLEIRSRVELARLAVAHD
jgi:DNA-binding CsgD family transcriptional regulator